MWCGLYVVFAWNDVIAQEVSDSEMEYVTCCGQVSVLVRESMEVFYCRPNAHGMFEVFCCFDSSVRWHLLTLLQLFLPFISGSDTARRAQRSRFLKYLQRRTMSLKVLKYTVHNLVPPHTPTPLRLSLIPLQHTHPQRSTPNSLPNPQLPLLSH